MPVIPALRRQRQENHEFEASLGYIAIPYLIKQSEQTNYIAVLMGELQFSF
jgi:hypothetical protein